MSATTTLRGALAGATAAAVWAAQQPLDQRVFGVRYDDTELLGRWATRSEGAWRPVGLALHLANGAVFGALYAAAAPSLPVPAALRGPLAGLAEHLATWPGTAAVPRVHPAGDRFPPLWGSGRAFAQATWRHVLFGAVLGELERRLNPPGNAEGPIDDATVSTNGHGSAEHLVSPGPASL
ncbi:MAG TPA: hypothetical protein VE526_06440 [Solirubrobacteraceae bacterium]|jgi:hypothetical protein|nr:hypothetical protein [Solirubrobacteraceae bacterium]